MTESPEQHAAVEAALAELETLEERPVEEHAAILGRAHEHLNEILDQSRSR